MGKKFTYEEFIKRVQENNTHDITILGTYINTRTKIHVRCNTHNIEYDVLPTSLLRGQGCKKCGRERAATSKRMSHDEFVERVELLNNGITVLDEYTKWDDKMRFECKNGHIFISTPNMVLCGKSCPYCSGNSILIGYNDLWTTKPDVAKLLKNPEDGYKYSKGSSAYLDFICPCCGEINTKSIANVVQFGFSCSICSDGVSYPNKFIRQLLAQLDIKFIPEYSPKWAKPKKYDCYFEYNCNKYIVEMDGRQHFCDNTFSKGSLKEIQLNDILKNNLAKQNGINIIRIDCSVSDCDYIKNNILTSELNNILDLTNVDWERCDINAKKSLIKSVCELYSNGETNLHILCDMSHLSICSVRNYLKVGSKYNWCDYDPVEATKQEYKRKSIPVSLLDNSGNIIKNFNSLRNCVCQMEAMYNIIFDRGEIQKSCKTHKPYKGFNFRYTDDTIQNY